jgi:hypothetical protein
MTNQNPTTELDHTAPTLVPDSSLVSTIVRAELDTQIATAKNFPRSLHDAINNINSLATLDEETAEECMYALPRGGKPIKGPSVRLAEIIAQQWGNCRVDARVIDIDRVNKVVVAEGTFHDLQTNSAMRQTTRRRISDKNGRLFNDDMIVVTGNAACAIARRNAILAGVPRGVWRKAYQAVEKVVAGDVKTLATRREAAVKTFAQFGVKPEQIFAALSVENLENVTLEHIPTLMGMYSALRSGEETVESMFDPRRVASDFEVVSHPLRDDDEEVPTNQAKPPDPKIKTGTNESGVTATTEKTAAESATEKNAPAATHPQQDELAVAEARGRTDHAKGMHRRAIPIEYRNAEAGNLATAWWRGWDTADSSSKGEAKQ